MYRYQVQIILICQILTCGIFNISKFVYSCTEVVY
jgi:hypothetical protein